MCFARFRLINFEESEKKIRRGKTQMNFFSSLSCSLINWDHGICVDSNKNDRKLSDIITTILTVCQSVRTKRLSFERMMNFDDVHIFI